MILFVDHQVIKCQVFLRDLLMNLVALDSIVRFGFPERRLGRGSPSSIPAISKRKPIVYVGFPVRMKQASVERNLSG